MSIGQGPEHVIELLRTAAARREARDHYLARYEVFAELEQLATTRELREAFHTASLLLLWAHIAETDNPVSEGLDD